MLELSSWDQKVRWAAVGLKSEKSTANTKQMILKRYARGGGKQHWAVGRGKGEKN